MIQYIVKYVIPVSSQRFRIIYFCIESDKNEQEDTCNN